jgi:hypothetical protein
MWGPCPTRWCDYAFGEQGAALHLQETFLKKRFLDFQKL